MLEEVSTIQYGKHCLLFTMILLSLKFLLSCVKSTLIDYSTKVLRIFIGC